MVNCLELYCGIGGFSAAAVGLAKVVEAIDISPLCQLSYEQNFGRRPQSFTIESLPIETFVSHKADLWWLSPPCQPYTRRGLGRDLADPRARSFLAVLEAIPIARPRFFLMENVPPFQASLAASRLRDVLNRNGYTFREWVLCPTQFGIANRRLRFYLAATRGHERIHSWGPFQIPPRRLASHLIANLNDWYGWLLPQGILSRYPHAIHVVDRSDPAAVTSCFTSAYGRSPVRSGSYLREGPHIRYFTPEEIIRLLGFPEWYRIPESLTREQAWRLVGNSLSVDIVQALLGQLLA